MRRWTRTSRRLRVGVDPELARLGTQTGHGKVWRCVLDELRASGAVRLVSSAPADVWLGSATAPAPPGRPFVSLVHEVGWYGQLREFLAPAFAEHLQAAADAVLPAAAHVIAVSEVARAQVIEAYEMPADRVHAVHSGVDHRVFNPGARVDAADLDAPYVLFVGVLHPRKNLDALRDAMAGLAEEGFPHRLLLIAGAAPDRAEPADVRAQLELPGLPGRLRLVRGISDREVAALMAGADAFCLPSFFEGFGLPALEAMACGAPVVASNRGALPELVADAGLVVEPAAAAVRDALREVLGDPIAADRLRAAAIARAAAFSWRRTADGWLSVLHQAAAEG